MIELLFMSSNGFPAFEAAPAIDQAIGVSVMTSNRAVIQALRTVMLQPV
jgi:maleate cis-trans isomerase